MSLAESVRDRLLNLSRKNSEPFNLVLNRYALERLLYRISQSKWNNDFLLKGAMLFAIWHNSPHRPTKDLDLLKYGNADINYIKEIFQAICNIEVEKDGIEFDGASISCTDIREGNIYLGIRVKVPALLAGAKLRLQVDIGFGDVVVPDPEDITYPTILEFPPPKIRSISKYTVVAEKFHAMVVLGIANSRMKDFYDIWIMTREFEFSGLTLCLSLESTFKRRETGVPLNTPFALTDGFSKDKVKIIQWNAFLSKNRFEEEGKLLPDIIQHLRSFLMPPVSILANKSRFNAVWPPGGPWMD